MCCTRLTLLDYTLSPLSFPLLFSSPLPTVSPAPHTSISSLLIFLNYSCQFSIVSCLCIIVTAPVFCVELHWNILLLLKAREYMLLTWFTPYPHNHKMTRLLAFPSHMIVHKYRMVGLLAFLFWWDCEVTIPHLMSHNYSLPFGFCAFHSVFCVSLWPPYIRK